MLKVQGHGKLAYKRANINEIQGVVVLVKTVLLSAVDENCLAANGKSPV